MNFWASKITRRIDIAQEIFRRKLDTPYHFPRCRQPSRPKGGQGLSALELDLAKSYSTQDDAREGQASRETGFSFHEISKASRRPPGTRTGEFIKIETRHLCRELRIRVSEVGIVQDTYLLEFVSFALWQNWDIEKSGLRWNRLSKLILDNFGISREFFAHWPFKIFTCVLQIQQENRHTEEMPQI